MAHYTLYLLIVNALSFALMLADKSFARKKLWRIPEKALLALAFLGGSAGVTLGMYLARHKTRHPQFSILVPILLIVQLWILLAQL